MTIEPDGPVLGPDGAAVGDVSREPAAEVWRRLWAARFPNGGAPGPTVEAGARQGARCV